MTGTTINPSLDTNETYCQLHIGLTGFYTLTQSTSDNKPLKISPLLRHYLQITGGVEQKIGRLQVAVQDVGRVDVLEPS